MALADRGGLAQAAALHSTILSGSTSSIRKDRRCPCLAYAPLRDRGLRPDSRSCSRRSCWARGRSRSTRPTTTRRSRSARSWPARSAIPTPSSPRTLDLPEVLRRLANLGAGYPDVVSILETAEPAEEPARPACRRRGSDRERQLPGSRPGERHHRQARRRGEANLRRIITRHAAAILRSLRRR